MLFACIHCKPGDRHGRQDKETKMLSMCERNEWMKVQNSLDGLHIDNILYTNSYEHWTNVYHYQIKRIDY